MILLHFIYLLATFCISRLLFLLFHSMHVVSLAVCFPITTRIAGALTNFVTHLLLQFTLLHTIFLDLSDQSRVNILNKRVFFFAILWP